MPAEPSVTDWQGVERPHGKEVAALNQVSQGARPAREDLQGCRPDLLARGPRLCLRHAPPRVAADMAAAVALRDEHPTRPDGEQLAAAHERINGALPAGFEAELHQGNALAGRRDLGEDLADVRPSAVITDPTTKETVQLLGISAAKLTQNQGDITFHT